MGSAATYFSLAEYDLNGNLEVSKVSNIDEYGNTGSPSTFSTTYVYNILDMVTSVTEPIDGSTNRTFSFEYDLIYRSSESTLPEGNKSATDYDELNRAIMSHAGYGNGVAKGSALITGEVFYDHNSNVIQAVDGRSNESDFTYAFDRLLKSEDRLTSNRNYTEYTYNRAGQVVDVTRKGNKRVESSGTYSFTADQLLAQSQTVYDNLGRAILSKVKAVSATGGNLGYGGLETANNYSVGWSTSRVKFRNNGQVESVYGDLSDNGSAPESYETKYEYDAYLRLLRVIDDRDGGGASTLDDDNYDQYAYDANGNVASVTAKLYDDAGLGDKTVTTYFFYDEINRLIEDESPSVQTVLPNGTISTGTLTREFKYDSRSNLVRTYDRKGVERVTQYDRINRPIRHKITDVEQRVINPSTGLLSPVVHDIVSRTVYDKNSNAAESIDPNGNRTYFRYDQAGRWLQTQHADGGTPLKTTAGSGHSITQVGSSVFYSKTGAYDGNSNLLKITDENNTETTYTYDNNDLLTGETGSAAGGNPHGIEGETGFEYLYDGMYRSVFGRSYDGTGTLTQIDSLFNSIGGLEQQRQRVLRAHPDDPGFTAEGTVLSKFDESGRRYQRTNPSGLTRVNWKFDRKHRPTETHQEFHNGSSWINGGLAAEYEYLGGGLMHSRQTRYIQQFHPGKSGGPGVATFPFVSTFERDDLLRITRVKHTRDDNDLGISDARLIGRYEYAYDHNSMMTWEARWYHHDADPTANFTPDETDFYSYASDNTLEKGTYSATQYGNDTGIEVANLKDAWAAFADDSDNEGTYSDRVYYGRRKTGTRDNVNWYRGTASGSSSTISQDDTSTGPQQTTSYNTSDDPGADHDNPASDGDGSRHNYTAIGQVDLDYDNNRNVLADGTRQFRYNYRNQLRRVWRKSDGASDGAIAMYREDAYGRRVYAHTHWELGRRVYFDTRFELDVNMDEDGNSHDMQYVDGGITATERSDTHERGLNVASWPSRLDRHYGIEQLTEEHYIDFLIDAPEADDSTLLGIIAYGSSSERYELEIYGEGYYELWFRDGGSNDNQIDGWHGDNASRRNIGLRFSHGNPGVWVNGGQESSTLAPPWPSPTIYFGTLGQDEFHGIVLLENLCYLRSFTRTQLDNSIPGGPRVTATFFDGPQPVTTTEIIEDGSTYQVVVRDNTDPSMSRLPEEGRNELYLVNGRRTTAHVITQGADRYALDGNNTVDMGSGNQAPGTSILLHTDAVGTTTARGRPNPAAIPKPEFIGGTLELTGHYNLDLIGTHFGSSQPPNPPAMSLVESGATYVGEEAQSDVEQGERTPTEGTDNCGCRGDNVSIAMSSVATGDPATGFQHDCLNGNAMDFHPGVQFSGDTIYALQHFKPGKDADGNDVMFFFIGGAKYQLIDATKDDDGLYNVNRDNLKLVEGTDYLKPATAQDWLDSLAEFGGTGGCKDPEADKKALETAEFVFDILGFIPVVGELADVAAGSLAFIQGDIVGAVLSLISTIPVVGDIIAKPIKWAYKAGKKIAWGKFYDLVTKALGDHCADAGLKALIQKKLKELRDFLNEGGLNLPAGWCFTAGTPVATDEGDKPIEELEVGDRVLTPETLNDQWTWTAVDPATWRVIVLELPNPGCEWDIIHLRLLRPLDWLVRHGLPGSMKILLEIDELGVHGLAKVLAIEACPPIRKGRGRVVTGTITHFNGFVKQLSFVGSERPLHPTDVHPFYSRTRKDWIQARHLQPGEEVATTTGSAVVDRVGNLPGIHRVYNLEVEREHCYFVGQELALAHNGCADDILDQFKGFIKKLPANPDDLAKNGWKEVSHPDAVKAGIRKFEDAHGNIIEFHKGTPGANGFKGKDHYHAKNPNATGKQDAYLDKDGNPVADGSKASHLLLD
jgi:YD repeat-containing protein